MKMDEKYLEEIRNQEKILNELNSPSQGDDSENLEDELEDDEPNPEPAIKPPSGQSTLFGGEQ